MSRIIALLCAFAAVLPAQSLMPWPAQITRLNGALRVEGTFHVTWSGHQEERLVNACKRLNRLVAAKTGVADFGTGPTVEVNCTRASEPVQRLGEDESYTLRVTPQGVELRAPTALGVLRGFATLGQLVEMSKDGFQISAVEISDSPRFPWRGLMIDVSRHWMPVEVVKRNLNAMEAVKLNVFHWHLSDDQGFRVESIRYPKLQTFGSDAHYYTQDQLREVVAYARERGIRVVPEFDIPGHSTSWLVGYPELGSAPGPYRIERKWGIMDPCLDPTNEEVYRLLDGFIGEMAAIFPDAYFHIGGDEVNGKQWNASPRIQDFMRTRGMKSDHDLQSYFNQRVLAIVTRHGKRMIGWDEVLHPGLPKDIVVHSWRGQKSLAEAARQGYSGILSSGYYLDLMHHTDEHYTVDPLEKETAGLTPEEQKRILGGEACEWSEMAVPGNIDARIWPRTAAIAERLWSPQSVRDVDSMYRRMAATGRHLEFTGVTHNASFRLMVQRLAGNGPVEPVRLLAEVIEPVKDYRRNEIQQGAYTSFTPLNRLVDVARPESEQARAFDKLVSQLPASAPEVRRLLLIWRDNHARLEPVLGESGILAEAAPLSQDVSALAAAGLAALDRIVAGKHDSAWVGTQQGLLKRAAAPRAECLISLVGPVQRLIERAR